MRRRPAALLAALTLTVAACSGTVDNSDPYQAAQCTSDTNLSPILTTIRTIESGNRYDIGKNRGGASGAYQYVDSTWNGYAGYQSAYLAPPATQDEKAAADVQAILKRSNGDVSAVPVGWYWPVALRDPSQMDIVPMPQAGNRLTIREYQTKWVGVYEQVLSGATVTPAQCAVGAPTPRPPGELPSQVECWTVTWLGYANGHIPYSAMSYKPESGYMHPQASEAFSQLSAAAEIAGFEIRGWAYRSAETQGATHAGGTGAAVGKSCHGLGLAIDITVLDPDNPPNAKHPYASTAAAFAAPEYQWMCAHADQYGFINPDWAQPAGQVCGPVTGNGHGGGTAGVLEPWHWESALTAISSPDFSH